MSRRDAWVVAYHDRGGKLHGMWRNRPTTKSDATAEAAALNEQLRRPKYLNYEAVRLPDTVLIRLANIDRQIDNLCAVQQHLRDERAALFQGAIAALEEPW